MTSGGLNIFRCTWTGGSNCSGRGDAPHCRAARLWNATLDWSHGLIGLWEIYRRFRHDRPQGGESPAGGLELTVKGRSSRAGSKLEGIGRSLAERPIRGTGGGDLSRHAGGDGGASCGQSPADHGRRRRGPATLLSDGCQANRSPAPKLAESCPFHKSPALRNLARSVFGGRGE